MDKPEPKLTRRDALKQTGTGCAAVAGFSTGAFTRDATAQPKPNNMHEQIKQTPFIDTHEHLPEEEERLTGKNGFIRSNDWSFLLSHYIDSDLISSGMPQEEFDRFQSKDVDPLEKWKILEPYWPSVRNTGYGQTVEIAMRALYDVDGLSKETVPRICEQYHKRIRPGFYREILQETAGIESCQVNNLGVPFSESPQPQLLMQDLSFIGMHMGPNIEQYAPKTGIDVKDLGDWHAVIDWWFKTYGPYAVAVKSQAAYGRGLDFDKVPAEQAAPAFAKRINDDPLEPAEKKRLEDHLFWYCVGKADEYELPVKLHTGYYAGHGGMPLARLQGNPGEATALCIQSPETRFVFMHICYPYYEAMIAAAKQHPNAYIDMCWAWIVSPVASLNFLKQYLVTAPANKVLTFGGDYIPVEPVVGHAAIARRGIANTLTELVQEGWMSLENATDLIEPIMNGNARKIFGLKEKAKKLQGAPWI